MSEDTLSISPNPCCTTWIKRTQKLEKSRDALRQSVKILEAQIGKQAVEITAFKKEIDKQQVICDKQNDERLKEVDMKKKLEKQILDMTVTISTLDNIKSLEGIDEDEINVLKTSISASQEEVKNLKGHLEKERRKADVEGRKTESEKKKAAEAWKLLTDEKRKLEELKCLLEAEKKKVEGLKFCLEKLKAESSEVREKLSAEIAKGCDAKKQIEVEKLKADGEKKRADSERIKAEEQKKLFEVERKRVLDVKKQVNCLCQKLEDERRKRNRAKVQKKLEDASVLSNFRDREQNVSRTAEAADLKILKKQLKLERKRVKHADRVAKHEKYASRVLGQEIHLLKQSLTQILYRLNMFDGLISLNTESTRNVEKTLNFQDLKCFKVNDFRLTNKDDYDSLTEFRPSEIQYGNPFTYDEPTGECIGLPVSGRCCIRPKTGINSELESPVGGSLRNKSQSSAVCSTSMHFSDRKLMGSQGRDSVVEISTSKLTENANTGVIVKGVSGDIAHKRKSCLVCAKDTDGSTGLIGVEKPCYRSYKVAAHICENSSKKRKIEINTKRLNSEANSLPLEMGDKGAAVNDRLRNMNLFSLENRAQSPAVFEGIDLEKVSLKERENNLCKSNSDYIATVASTHPRTAKSTVKFSNKKKASKPISGYNRNTFCVQEAAPDSSEFGIEPTVISFGNKQTFLKSFENMISGGCLKLLELDDFSDEIRYINALENPLSPTLPEIEIPNYQIDREDDSLALIPRDYSVPFCSSDVMDLEILSNNLQSKNLTHKEMSNRSITRQSALFDIAFDAFQEQQEHYAEHFPAEHNNIELEAFPVSKACSDNFPCRCRTSEPLFVAIGGSSEPLHSQLIHDIIHPPNVTLTDCDSSEIKLNEALGGCEPMNSDFIRNQAEVKTIDDSVCAQRLNIVLPSDVDKLTQGNNLISVEECTGHGIRQQMESAFMPKDFVLTFLPFSSTVKPPSKTDDVSDPVKKKRFVTSFTSARNMDCMSKIICSLSSLTPQKLMISKADSLIIEFVEFQLEDFQSEEKAAVFFSLLLNNLTIRMSDHCKYIMDEESFQILESFSMEIVRGVSAGMFKFILDKMFHLDTLFHLIESFLITREVLVIGDVQHHSSSFPAITELKLHMKAENCCVISKDVSTNEFIAGCTILSSICVAIDDISFLLRFSYKIMRMCQDDITWVLLALHVFANVCGKKFFIHEKSSFLVTTINSVVALIEERFKLISYPLPDNPNSSRVFADFLPCKHCPFAANAMYIDKLVSSLLDALENYSLNGGDYSCTINFPLNRTAPTRIIKDKNSSATESKFDARCDVTCSIFRYRKLAGNQSDSCLETMLCDYADIISLVELVACYMGWVWMYNETMPRLLKMLEVCALEEYLVALFVLVGELGRLGCASCDYQQAGIADLRRKLADLFNTLITRNASLPTQVAAVGAMLNLLPLKYHDISYRDDNNLSSCESRCINHIQKWFFGLSGEQQVALRDIFDYKNYQR